MVVLNADNSVTRTTIFRVGGYSLDQADWEDAFVKIDLNNGQSFFVSSLFMRNRINIY